MEVNQLTEELNAWVAGDQDTHILIMSFRDAFEQARLPQKYSDVLEGILSRLESSSLFTEESCSFSKKDLAAALSLWLQKAQQASMNN
ncbi:MAG: hypothetical protein ACKOD7_03475 [Polynucleobacter victoriensis]